MTARVRTGPRRRRAVRSPSPRTTRRWRWKNRVRRVTRLPARRGLSGPSSLSARGPAYSSLQEAHVSDVLVVVAELIDSGNLVWRNGGGQTANVSGSPVDEVPVHDRFHEGRIMSGGREVRDQQTPARRHHAKQRGRQRPRQIVLEIVVEPGGIHEVGRSQLK